MCWVETDKGRLYRLHAVFCREKEISPIDLVWVMDYARKLVDDLEDITSQLGAANQIMGKDNNECQR